MPARLRLGAQGYPYARADVNIIDVNFEKGQTFDHPTEAGLMSALTEYGPRRASKRVGYRPAAARPHRTAYRAPSRREEWANGGRTSFGRARAAQALGRATAARGSSPS